MRFQIASDLHLEFGNQDPTEVLSPAAPHLILAGDITNLGSRSFHRFFRWCSEQYRTVLYVPGNHEYYGGRIDRVDGHLAQALERYENIHLLQCGRYDLDHVTILGATLWSYIPDAARATVRRQMNDYRLIKGMSINQTNRLFHTHRAWLDRQLEALTDRTVMVVTHYPPLMGETSHPKYRLPRLLNHAFASDLDQLVAKADVWVSGHTHYSYDFVEPTGCRLVANQRGHDYDTDNDWRRDFVIDL